MGAEIFSVADGLEECCHVLFPDTPSVTGDAVVGRVSGASWRRKAAEDAGEMGVLVSVMVEPLAPAKRGECSGVPPRRGG